MKIENNKIRIHVRDEYWEKVVAAAGGGRKQILPSGDIRVEPAESVARGRILSDAMARIQFKRELNQVAESGPSLEPARVRAAARATLVTRWLGENARHRDTLERYSFGYRLATGQAMDVAEA
jgi:hypothetical protein